MAITAEMVKDLREKTGAGIMDCKEALQASQGDVSTAIEYLRKKGLAAAAKKAGRATTEGIIGSYIHLGGRIGVLIEVNCETDFVARNEIFGELVKDLAMQVAAAKPLYLSRSEVPAELLDRERRIYREQALASGKPEKVLDRIVEGKLEKYFEETCLLDQAYVRDPDRKIEQVIGQYVARIGENLTVRRFARFQVGEELEGA